MYSIGIDIGYSTIKYIVLDEKDNQIYQDYYFHHGNTEKELINILQKVNTDECYIGITGEQAKRFVKLEKYYINEIPALIEGSLYRNKNINSVIEIGAQRSKYITDVSPENKANIKFSMNSSCSAGTGAFLEEQVSRLEISLDEYSTYIKKATKIPRIAGRCSVFSKTDMIHHQQEGTKIEDILLGLAYSLVRNYKSNVVQKLEIKKPIMFIGGVAHNEGVINAIKDIFKLSNEDIIIPSKFHSIGALGALLIARENSKVIKHKNFVKDIQYIERKDTKTFYQELNEFGKNDSVNKHVCKTNESYEGYLGIDIGSTSTNFVLIDDDKNVLAYRYIRTKGNPKVAVSEGIQSINNEFDGKIEIKGMGTTGSGRNLIGKNLDADLIVNEITAQAKGAVEIDKDVDTIFEIGGQDSKYISIKDEMVVDFEMNKICAAGTGSFIEEQAKKLDIPIEEFEKFALDSENPLELGERCTVFIEGNIAKALSSGHSKEDITAGLSYSIVKNYLNRVVGKKDIGKKIFLQGGIAHNQAVVNAFRSVLGKDIVIPPFFSVTGAYGVALLTKEKIEENMDISNKQSDFAEDVNVEEEIEKLFLKGYTEEVDKGKLTIGIPRVLFLHKLFPMFNEIFKSLGFNVILSKPTDKEIINLSQEYSLDETCYPVKLINGHVAYLIEKGVDYIFLPSLYTMKHPISKAREDYACVYMQTAPKIVSSVMDLEEKGIKMLAPSLSFKFGKGDMMKTLMQLGKDLGKNKIETAFALKKGMKRFNEFGEDVEKLGEKVLNNLRKDEKAFVIVTRAYGVADEELNMQIPKKLREMGHKVLTLSNIPAHSYDLSEDYPNMYWSFGQHILSGAKIIRENPNLHAIYLTNHGCGPDAILSHYFREEMKGKPYLHIEVDEHSSSVGVLTRLEAFINSLEKNKNIPEKIDSKTTKKEKKDKKIFIPNMYPYSQIVCEVLRKRGMDVHVLPKTTKESFELGKKFSISKEYFSCVSLIGDVFYGTKNLKKDDISLWIPKTEGSESFGQYSELISRKLREEGHDIEINSPFVEDLLEEESYGIEFALSMIAADLVMVSDVAAREDYLAKILKMIREDMLTKENLINVSKDICKQIDKKTYLKNIHVLGEFNVVFNPFLNNFQIDKLEKKNKIYYEPFSEMLYFKWMDYFNKEKKNKKLKENLKLLKEVMDAVSFNLGKYSSFDKDVNELIKEADTKLPLYSGGAGRYRMAKIFRCNENIDGILALNSMYENTGTILKLLRNKYKIKKPVLDLAFDGSDHSNNEEGIKTFVYYM